MAAANKKDLLEKKELACLVAGGAGFIGSHLCETLLDQNFTVYCLDNLSSGSKDNLKNLLTNQNFHFIEADITEPLSFLDSIEKLDTIFHLASLEVKETGKDFSLETLLVNSTGTRNLLEAAKKLKAKFILVSSGNIYQGSFSSNSLKYFFGGENQEAVMSQNEAKRFAEALTVEYFKNYKLEATIVRVEDVYGPKMNLAVQSAMTRLISEAKQGEKITVHGDGLTTLNPTFVSDVVFGLIKIMLGDFQGEVFNLISPEKTTEMGLAETLRLVSGKLEIVHEEQETKFSFPPPALDTDNTKEKLKWIPRVTLAEGLSSIFQSFREVEPAKMVSLTSLPLEETRPERPEPKPAKKGTWSRWARLTVFLGSLFLILFTTVVPFVNFVLNLRSAGTKNETAFASLDSDQTKVTSDNADQVNQLTDSAERNLNTVRWLFQLTGQRESLKANEQLIFSLGNTASGIKLLSQVSQDLLEAENQTDTSKVADLLREASQILADAKQDLDLGKVSLGQISENKLALGLNKTFETTKSINAKAATSADTIEASLEETLKKIDGSASTVP